VLTSFCWLFPVKTKSTEEVAQHLYSLVCDFGPFRQVQSDNGFSKEQLSALVTSLQSQHVLSTPWHPQAIALTERHNKEIGLVLNKLCEAEPRSWARVLPLVQHLLNRRPMRRLLDRSPFFAMFGRFPDVFADFKDATISKLSTAKDIADRIQHVLAFHKHVFPAFLKRGRDLKEVQNIKLDAKPKLVKRLKVGQPVLYRNIGRSVKFGAGSPFLGPVLIASLLPGGGGYKLKYKGGEVLAGIFAPEHLRPVRVVEESVLSDPSNSELELVLNHQEVGDGVTEFLVVTSNSDIVWLNQSKVPEELKKLYYQSLVGDEDESDDYVPPARDAVSEKAISVNTGEQRQSGRPGKGQLKPNPIRNQYVRYGDQPVRTR